METFSALLAICAGNSQVPGEFPGQRPVVRNFDVFFDLRLNKRLIKQSWGWWSEKLSRPLWRHCNDDRGHPCIFASFYLNIQTRNTTLWFVIQNSMYTCIFLPQPDTKIYIQVVMKVSLMKNSLLEKKSLYCQEPIYLLNNWIICLKIWFDFLMLFTLNVITFCEFGRMQCIFVVPRVLKVSAPVHQ